MDCSPQRKQGLRDMFVTPLLALRAAIGTVVAKRFIQ